MTIGRWSNGEEIDIAGVPLRASMPSPVGGGLIVPFTAKNGGIFLAMYSLTNRDGCWWVYELSRVEESMPPTPPQLQVYSELCRIPHWHAADEADARRIEWAEALSH